MRTFDWLFGLFARFDSRGAEVALGLSLMGYGIGYLGERESYPGPALVAVLLGVAVQLVAWGAQSRLRTGLSIIVLAFWSFEVARTWHELSPQAIGLRIALLVTAALVAITTGSPALRHRRANEQVVAE